MNQNQKHAKYGILLVMATAMAVLAPVRASDSEGLELMNEAHQVYYYAGEGGQARVTMEIVDSRGRTREREFWMLRSDLADMGDQRYYTYFLKPADVRRTTFLVHKHAEGNDDRWLYIPALDLVKRIAANDRGSSFMGSHFSYEDVSGRLPLMDTHQILGQESVDGRAATKVKSTPKEAGTADYAYRLTWVCNESHLPLREEYYGDDGEVQRRFEILEVADVEGIPTAVKRSMEDVDGGGHTVLHFSELSYEPPLEAQAYNERLLKNPPREYTR